MAENETETVLLTGASGLKYEFEVFDPEDSVPPVGGVFVVSGRDAERTNGPGDAVWLVGRAANLSRTLSLVKRHARVLRTARPWRYCVRVERDDRAARSRIAKDLAARYRPMSG